ncbi:UDP-N-acetylmuramoyl-L-alanyl-D-glutamate--2,6-diaminopimelate ligase [Marinomonas sp. C2222]|uniref:UDP-N-acetylmuramoyl-L-alanyl-D-glutamate--2,6-diaminopimelate ligase n=1 Tax=Marinomonas sargassi TaxID=2984494 RepID=A0ABT2YT45_9GAMM|nr:UDP-N-acetylmuramoyl-L-alanyl-D-glutamate--2,6-diaminopimelate ligase [Marinomonas sargassi]MCV2403088.1 UDP-N-acetylmuramoyl-L-alanyl-D-glutamate--2,6-diaminopimelate ligase [Marinomonas sargassi]
MAELTHVELLELASYSPEESSLSALYTHIETDSRKADENSIFFALPGVATNGWDYLDQVALSGCKTAVVPKELNLQHDALELVGVDHPTELMIQCAQLFYGDMPKQMVAVTGTNGKSSICYYLAQLAQAIGLKGGLVGTFGIGPLNALSEAEQTTPDLLSLHRTLRGMAATGIELVAFEASSHALDQGRMEGVPFQTAVFSNLSRDHLDYHGDMASYALAKSRLFSFPGVQHSIICADDAYADFMAKAASQNHCHYYSEQNSGADFFVKNLQQHANGFQFVLCCPDGEYSVSLPLLGHFNVQNALAALAALWNQTEDKAHLIKGLSCLKGAPGRMDKVEVPNAPLVVVDFAHTSDALQVALQALKEHVNGRLICVFGCGGDRDRGKRPLMMDAALKNADFVWLTSDNPRTESVEQILSDCLAAVGEGQGHFSVEGSRKEAIQKAILAASSDDVILLAGKGHETYQDIDGVKHHFDDKEEAMKALKNYVA